jgi:hypothetical protein
MTSLQHQHLEVKTQRHPVLQIVLIEGINYHLLHLSEILQPTRAVRLHL